MTIDDFVIQQVRSTLEHIRLVQKLMRVCIGQLTGMMIDHDRSKFDEDEWPEFLKHTHTLAGMTYGSPEYKNALEEMKPAIEKHYSKNRHHPEHFGYRECNGCFTRYPLDYLGRCTQCGYSQFQLRPDIQKMNLLELLEMICDWRAATERHKDGDILKSIEVNQERFGYSDELKEILKNTVKAISPS